MTDTPAGRRRPQIVVALGEYGVQKSTSVTSTTAVAETLRYTTDALQPSQDARFRLLHSLPLVVGGWIKRLLDPTNRHRPSLIELGGVEDITITWTRLALNYVQKWHIFQARFALLLEVSCNGKDHTSKLWYRPESTRRLGNSSHFPGEGSFLLSLNLLCFRSSIIFDMRLHNS